MTPGIDPVEVDLRRASTERDLEAQAERVARRTARTSESNSGRSGTADDRVPADVRAPVERELGIDLSDVRVRTGRSAAQRVEGLGADGLTQGDEIHLATGRFQPAHPIGRELLRHELVHVAQQRTSSGGDGPARGVERPLRARRGGLQLGACIGGTRPDDKLRKGTAMSRAEAVAVLDAYGKMSAADRDTKVAELYRYGDVTPKVENLLDALSEQDRVVTYADVIRDILQRVQARATAGAAGKSFTDLAKVQGAHMEAESRAEALEEAKEEAKKKGLPPPKTVTPGQVSRAHQTKVKKETKFTPQVDEWAALGKKGQDAWWPMAQAVRKSIIDLAKKEVPAMKLTEADIKLDPERIAKRSLEQGMSVFSLSGRPMKVGIAFIEAAKANPGYVLGSVLHEIYGHPLHGGSGESYAWRLFRESTKHFPSYQKPAESKHEKRLYGYPETEIYAEMIEATHSTRVSAADRKKGIGSSDRPETDIEEQVGRLARNLEPSVARAVLLGMWERFRIDPRLSPDSLEMFKDAVNAQTGMKGAIK